MSLIKNNFSNYLYSLWTAGGIKRGDKLLIHSNLKNILLDLKKKKFSFTVEDIIFNLLDFLGQEGTLIFPSFSFKFVDSKFFSLKKTKSEMGIMSETARKLAKQNRTWNPIYSFSILGNVPNAEIKKKNYSALGNKSIFNWIIQNDGKIILIDLADQNSMTIYHHIEEINNADWRFHKIFEGNYIDWNENRTLVKAKTFVRKDKDAITTNVLGMQNYLMEKKLYFCQFKNSIKGIRSIKAKVVKTSVEKILKNNGAEGMLYTTK